VNRVLNKRTLKDGVVQYLVKWTDLGYAESTWEDEDEEIPELPLYIQYYEDLRYVCGVDGAKKKKKKKKGEGEEEERPRKYNPPPDKPTTSLDVKYKVKGTVLYKKTKVL
jgi:chromodomain-helicase-DNA-binding protein 4